MEPATKSKESQRSQPFFIDPITGKIVYGASAAVLEHKRRKGYDIFCCSVCTRVFEQEGLLREHEEAYQHWSSHSETDCDCEVSSESEEEPDLTEDLRPVPIVDDNEGGQIKNPIHEDNQLPVTKKRRPGPQPHNPAGHFQYLDHINDYHKPSASPNPCENCSKVLQTKYGFQRHQAKHQSETGDRGFKCSFCNEIFSDKDVGRVHVRTCHRQGIFRCIICEKYVIALLGLEKTEKLYFPFPLTKNKLACTICNRVLSTNANLNRHLQLTHRTSLPYRAQCPNCDKTYAQSDNLKRHIKTHHPESVPDRYECDKCDMSFTQRRQLKAHERRIHSDSKVKDLSRSFKCPECERGFKLSRNLKRHIAHIHSLTPKRFQCPTCEKSYVRQDTLKLHVKKAHSNAVKVNDRFHCLKPKCNKSYSLSYNLTRHIRIAH